MIIKSGLVTTESQQKNVFYRSIEIGEDIWIGDVLGEPNILVLILRFGRIWLNLANLPND
jgi:hypothetical protein